MTNRSRKYVVAAAFLAAGIMAAPMAAVAAPSAEDVEAAKQAESVAEMSVAQLEVGLASVRAEAQAAQVAAQVAAEDLNQANVDLEAAKQAEETAKQEAATALAAFEKGREELGAVVQEAHRSGSASLDGLAPYLTPGGLSDVESKRSLIESFGTAADAQLQEVMALKQVSDVMATAAEKARAAKEDAVAKVAEQADAAQAAAESAVAVQEQSEIQYAAMLSELAAKRNTTIQLEEERQAEAQRQQEAAAEAEAKRQAELVAPQAPNEPENEYTEPESPTDPDPYVPPTPDPTPDPDPYVPPTPDPDPTPTPPPAPPSSGGVSGAIATAKQLLGAPYVWGGEGPGYDCSGLVTVAYRSVGIYLTHQSRSQYAETYKVSINSMQAGDLVFWSSNGAQSGIYHVAIYLGDGQIIEAPTFGVPVRITSIYNWGQVMPYAGRVV